jgi:hypothetical protein
MNHLYTGNTGNGSSSYTINFPLSQVAYLKCYQFVGGDNHGCQAVLKDGLVVLISKEEHDSLLMEMAYSEPATP